MKLKTNKLLTLTLASSLVAITAGCGGSKAAAPTGTTPTPPPADTVAYSDWSGDATLVTATTANGFVAGTATGLDLTPALTGVASLNLASQVAPVNGTVSAITLGGAAVDGVAFASNGATTATELRYFAALHSGTDLGAPVPTTGAEAIWSNGLFQAVGAAGTYATASKTFALTVTFGTADADRTITALVGANTNADAFTATGTSYYISGNYDAAGVITGNVLYGDFSAADNDPDARTAAAGLLTTATGDTPTDPETVGLGVLSGLIGAQGAVGGFYSSGSDGNGETGFAGGFVVSALANLGGVDSNAVYADWSGSATLVTSETEANGFAAGTAAGLGIAALTASTLDLNDTYAIAVDGIPASDTDRDGTPAMAARILPGAGTDGVAFAMHGTGDATRFFAGLHLGTDLGAPIDAQTDISGDWNGLFQAVGATGYAVSKTFVLTVTFDADGDNTIVGFVPVGDDTFTTDGDDSYYLSGTYDENGVITGNILYGDFATGNDLGSDALTAAALALTTATATTGDPSTVGLGVLSGLIGQAEAVGAFYSSGSDGTGTTGYAGGFVSTKTAIAPAVETAVTAFDPISYTDWTGSFSSPTLPTDSATTAPTANAFVTGTATGLSLPSTGNTVVNLTLNSGALTGDVLDGVAFGSTTTSPVFYAGLLNTTDLNGPLTSATAGGAWTGLFQAVGATGYETAAKNFTLTVDFDNTAFNAHVPVGATTVTDASASGVNSYYLAGTFVAATGVMTGTIIRGDYSAGTNAAGARGLAVTALGDTTNVTAGRGTVTGLIGQGGAIGAFFSADTGATGYAGGFVANNP